MPRVCRIVNTLPISAVSLPFSSSVMNRRPVPEPGRAPFALRQAPCGSRGPACLCPVMCISCPSSDSEKLPYGNILDVLHRNLDTEGALSSQDRWPALIVDHGTGGRIVQNLRKPHSPTRMEGS